MVHLRRTAGLESSFSEFVARASSRLLHTAELLTGDRFEAEDVVQVVLLRMFVRWHRIEQQDPVGYARRAVVNEVTDRWRRHRFREVLRAAPQDGVAPGDAAAALAGRDAALQMLSVLTARERAVVVLRYWDNLSEEQTADVLGIARGTVKSTASRALGKLRVAHPAPGEEAGRHG